MTHEFLQVRNLGRCSETGSEFPFLCVMRRWKQALKEGVAKSLPGVHGQLLVSGTAHSVHSGHSPDSRASAHAMLSLEHGPKVGDRGFSSSAPDPNHIRTHKHTT